MVDIGMRRTGWGSLWSTASVTPWGTEARELTRLALTMTALGDTLASSWMQQKPIPLLPPVIRMTSGLAMVAGRMLQGYTWRTML